MRLGLSVLASCSDLSVPVMDGGDFLAGSVTAKRRFKSDSESTGCMLDSSASCSCLSSIGAARLVRKSMKKWLRKHEMKAPTYRGF